MSSTAKESCIVAVVILLFATPSLFAAAPKRVSLDGQGDYHTIQAAIDSVPIHNSDPVIIEIAPGRYHEHVAIPQNKPFITLRGMGNLPADVWIGDVIERSGAILTASANDFLCEHLTLEDQSVMADTQGRSAIALGALRQVIEDCDIRGTHNTVFVKGGTQAYLHACSITGTGDVVYGAGTAYFDTCNVLITATAGTIATPSTPKDIAVGFVFVDCHLTGPPSRSPALMRPWTADGATAFIRCCMDNHFAKQGWSAWEGRELTCRAEEFGSTTPDEKPLDMSARPAWVRRLSTTDAKRYTLANVYPGWSPNAYISE